MKVRRGTIRHKEELRQLKIYSILNGVLFMLFFIFLNHSPLHLLVPFIYFKKGRLHLNIIRDEQGNADYKFLEN